MFIRQKLQNQFELFGYDCYYYDIDPLVCKANKNIAKNIINKDVIFDDIKILDVLLNDRKF